MLLFFTTNIGVEIHTNSTETNCSNVFKADAVVMTVPLGVLKSSTISFHPQLPEWKQQAINNLGFGLLNKVAIHLAYVMVITVHVLHCNNLG